MNNKKINELLKLKETESRELEVRLREEEEKNL